MALSLPDPFFKVRIENIQISNSLHALCAGFEGGKWRSRQLAEHLFNWLPYAALNQEHQLNFGASNFLEMLKTAAAHIYSSKKTESRGELGELLLHIACVGHFGCVPILCKLILKTSSNDTVKGFDGVHLLLADDHFELWLGESKFYKDPKRAITDAIESIRSHILPEFLATEKAMILGHVAEGIPQRERVRELFRTHTSSDELLDAAVFPILIGYNSDAVGSFDRVCAEYNDLLEEEVAGLSEFFKGRSEMPTLKFRLIFVPMNSKADVISNFDALLRPFLP